MLLLFPPRRPDLQDLIFGRKHFLVSPVALHYLVVLGQLQRGLFRGKSVGGIFAGGLLLLYKVHQDFQARGFAGQPVHPVLPLTHPQRDTVGFHGNR